MLPDIERTILHYYPQRTLTSPLDNKSITWDYDTSYATLKQILAELKAIDPTTRPGTRGRYDISEENVVADSIHIQLSYLGPYAALNHGFQRELSEDEREVARQVTRVLEKHGVRVLEEGELLERAPWIQHANASVWDCLFVLPG